ncbi:MFS transporter [Streptomyces sp. BH106]|uniref:MFS transporter n=1 Tax=Streptomyces sp. BH106 TaxID=3410409 RepID=UPI003CEB8913
MTDIATSLPGGETRPPAAQPLGVRGWLTLLTLCGATFMTGLDYSIIMVALPEIGEDLGFASTSSLQWVATACVLPTAALLPLCGRLSDLTGRRRLFLMGVGAFTALSLLAGLATSPGLLIAARAGQGIAAAAIGATAMALMTTVFPEGPRRTKALSINGALLSLGFVIGTIGGGVIVSGLNWRWTMLLLVAMGALILTGGLGTLPRVGGRTASSLDVPGALLASGGLFALVYAVSTGADAGWSAPSTLGAFVAAVALLGGFLAAEARHHSPLVPLRLLNRPSVKWSSLIGLITFGMCGGTTLLLSLYMQDVLGWSPLRTGFGFLAEGAAALLAGTLASRLIGARGTVPALVTGLTVQGVGTAAMVWLPAEGNLPLLLVTSGAMGLGHVLTVVAFITTLTSGLPDEDQGVAGSLAQMPQFVGAIGVAGLSAVATARTAALNGSTGETTATLGGLHAAMLTAGVITLAGLGLTALLRRRLGAEHTRP